MRLLIAEDELDLAEALTVFFEKNHFSVDAVHNGFDAYEYAASGGYDGVILDVMMPKMNGIQVLERLRAEGCRTPIMMLTAKGQKDDRITGFNAGADDYLIKPFALEELSARLRVLTRSQFGAGDSRLVAGDLTLDTGTRRVKRGGAEIALSAREYVMHNKGIVLSREKIENHVWNFDYEGGTNVVDVYIRYLRKKIDDGHERKLIHTVRGMGYVLREETP